VASYAKPGVTRALQWVRLAGELDLLDAPGGCLGQVCTSKCLTQAHASLK
jgi:ribosome biogenesis GTPase A